MPGSRDRRHREVEMRFVHRETNARLVDGLVHHHGSAPEGGPATRVPVRIRLGEPAPPARPAHEGGGGYTHDHGQAERKERQVPRIEGQRKLHGGHRLTSSTRRFRARPSSVSLRSLGLDSPKPTVVSRPPAIPNRAPSAVFTAAARRDDSARLYWSLATLDRKSTRLNSSHL